MAITIDYSTSPRFTIRVPQGDLTLILGSLYELDTDVFRLDLKALEAAEQGIVFQDTHRHNTEVTVAGTTFARTVEVLNSSNSSQLDKYQVLFTPDTQYSVRLVGSNNNIFDLQNFVLDNAVTQVIPTNSAGLIISGSTLTPTQQQIRDAMKLTPTVGLPASGSVDSELDILIAGQGTADGKLTTLNTVLTEVRKILKNKQITDPNTGVMTIFDDDDTALLVANLFQDAAGTIPYAGAGAERRERFVAAPP